MNFRTLKVVSLSLVKEFVFTAKRQGFAATDTKVTLADQTSVYSYRPFSDPGWGGMIYTDRYNGNTIEGGQESVTIDLVLRWRNQYYGGTSARFWETSASHAPGERRERPSTEKDRRFPEVVSAFLKQALMRLPGEFPVRGPREFRASKVKFENTVFRGDWIYRNEWHAVPLFETDDPFASFVGQEQIHLNGAEVYWHGYQGGFVRDKHFPFSLSLI